MKGKNISAACYLGWWIGIFICLCIRTHF